MTIAYVALGGNEGDRLANLEGAVGKLAERATVVALSPIYETEPVGFVNQGWFLNAVAAIETTLSAGELMGALQEIERQLGKATPFPNGPRTLDLDLLLIGDEVVDEPDLQVPHARMHERAFVLRPLADIAGEAIHPAQGRSISAMLTDLRDGAAVQAWTGASTVFPSHPAA